jgi:hypothetical protein
VKHPLAKPTPYQQHNRTLRRDDLRHGVKLQQGSSAVCAAAHIDRIGSNYRLTRSKSNQ